MPPADAASGVDALYERFSRSLPVELRSHGQTLAFQLKLVPAPQIPWSEVFKHAVTLRAPEMFVAPGVTGDAVATDLALFAHLLSVIEAFGTDRIVDGQVTDQPPLRAVLAAMRAARNDALRALGGTTALAMAADADSRTHGAIASERRILGRGESVTVHAYETIAAAKQSVGLTASVALQQALGASGQHVDRVGAALLDICLGLQFQDDVVDWEDDFIVGGAWAVALVGKDRPRPASELTEVRRVVHASGVMASMLELAADRFSSALAAALEVGTPALIDWLTARVDESRRLSASERGNPGRVLRMRKLSAWNAEVLA